MLENDKENLIQEIPRVDKKQQHETSCSKISRNDWKTSALTMA